MFFGFQFGGDCVFAFYSIFFLLIKLFPKNIFFWFHFHLFIYKRISIDFIYYTLYFNYEIFSSFKYYKKIMSVCRCFTWLWTLLKLGRLRREKNVQRVKSSIKELQANKIYLFESLKGLLPQYKTMFALMDSEKFMDTWVLLNSFKYFTTYQIEHRCNLQCRFEG